MTLAFSTYLDGRPTHFVEKIWECLLTSDLDFKDISEYFYKIPGVAANFTGGLQHPKRHTIRRDEKDRWKKGRYIHMVIHNRTPQRFQFAPVVKCMSVQKIEITKIKSGPVTSHLVKVDGKIKFDGLYLLFHDTHKGDKVEEFLKQKRFIRKLAYNDGFDSVNDFFEYFDKDFTGKIIHWTNLKY